MTALEEEPLPREQQLPEAPLAEQPTRFLGNVALEGETRDWCEDILRSAVGAEVQTPADFNTHVHAFLLTHVRTVNEENGRTSNSFVVSPQRVEDALTDYYTLFPEANTPGDVTMPKARANHLSVNQGYAMTYMRMFPEINLLMQLEPQFRTRAGNEVANAARDLLAAYGWAIRPDYGATRINLFRDAGKTHLLANKRKPYQ